MLLFYDQETQLSSMDACVGHLPVFWKVETSAFRFVQCMMTASTGSQLIYAKMSNDTVFRQRRLGFLLMIAVNHMHTFLLCWYVLDVTTMNIVRSLNSVTIYLCTLLVFYLLFAFCLIIIWSFMLFVTCCIADNVGFVDLCN